MTRLRQLAWDVWILTKGYWGSEERWSARLLLTGIIGLNFGLVGVNVLQNQANGALFTALQQQNAPGFYRAFVIVILLILLYLAVAVLRVYLENRFKQDPTCFAVHVPNTAPSQGALPIKIGDEVIGAAGVSGAPGGDKDEACAKAGLDKVADQLK